MCGTIYENYDVGNTIVVLNQTGGYCMKLTFIGAAHEVTGSCHYLEVGGKHILVDCGMEQGINAFENASLPIA